jgi:hypothetical protein
MSEWILLLVDLEIVDATLTLLNVEYMYITFSENELYELDKSLKKKTLPRCYFCSKR